MTSHVAPAVDVLRGTDRRRDVTIVATVTALGVAFNLARLAARLDQSPLVASLAGFWALLGIAVVLARVAGIDRESLGVVRPRSPAVWVGAAVAAVVFILVAATTTPQLHTPSIGQAALALLFFGGATAPAEEFLFRGVLYGAVERRDGPLPAIALSSLAFAIAHVPVYGFESIGLALFAGLILGWLRHWSGSLLPPAAVHVVADLALLWL